MTCWVDLLDADGDPVSRAGNSGKDSAGFTGKLEVQNANFWWPFMMHQDPGYLYTLEVSIISNRQFLLKLIKYNT